MCTLHVHRDHDEAGHGHARLRLALVSCRLAPFARLRGGPSLVGRSAIARFFVFLGEITMSFVSLSRSAVRADLAPLVVESRRLARLLRLPFTRPMGDEQRAKARLARRITELSVLLAHLRGKLHVTSRPLHALPASRAALPASQASRATFPEDVTFDAQVYARTIAEAVAVVYTRAPASEPAALPGSP